MPASQWFFYDDFLLNEGNGKYDLAGHELKVCLVQSASNAINQALVGATYAALTNEVPDGNGYTLGGQTVTQSFTGGGASTTCTLAGNTLTWTGEGTGFAFRAAVLYDATAGYLVAYCLGDATPADVTVAAGVPLNINVGTMGTKSRA